MGIIQLIILAFFLLVYFVVLGALTVRLVKRVLSQPPQKREEQSPGHSALTHKYFPAMALRNSAPEV
jgi:hypothetical protein